MSCSLLFLNRRFGSYYSSLTLMEMKMPVLRQGFQEARKLQKFEEPVFHLGTQNARKRNGEWCLCLPPSFQRGLQHCGVSLRSAGRVPPGQLRNSGQTHSGWLLHPANKVGPSFVFYAFSSVLCVSITKGTVSGMPFVFPKGQRTLISSCFYGEVTERLL